ncbi:hypothetical protein GOP47_0022170 [Adiantum capillus-veneris]|uniref:RING-type E3 ubiquitin transferase n=1 Tax=Adiantum capillus-veneris TaxID=13818 RepID=A0A9D4U8L6_ADICA|nr:hypothetical protein GOP47_0021550 [Adiantum capillus-veneris]KAI5063623.1 hypothetical protein GOP47_0022170 [Adiantum capillus-veneris]
MPRARTSSFGGKSDGIGKMAKLLEDDERYSSRCGSSYQRTRSRSSVYFGNSNSSNATAPGKQESYAASSSSSLGSNDPHVLTAVQNDVVGSSDESGSDFDNESGSRRLLDSHGVLEPGDWANTSVLSPVDEQSINKEDSLGVKPGASSRHRGQSVRPLGWRDRYVSQPARLHDSMSKNNVDGRAQRGSTACPSQRAYRKGSSSKAPQTDDLTAPLLLEKKSRPVIDKVVQGESEGRASVSVASLGSKNRSASNLRRVTHSTSISIEGASRRKGNSQTFYGHRTKSEEIGAGHRDMSNNGSGSSRRGLSNLVCSSAADVLPSVSTSALSNFACSSAADVLPSVPSTLAGTRYFRPRQSSRAFGLEGVASTSMQPVKRQAEELQIGLDHDGLDHEQGLFGPGLTAHESTRSPQSREEPLGTNFVTCETSIPASTAPPMPNYRHWGRNVAMSRSGDGLGSFYRSSSPFFEATPAFGEELSNPWSSRRRSLYGSRTDPVGPDSRSSSRNLSHGRPSSSTWSVLRETHYPQSRFPGPPARPPPPPPPPLAGFAEPNPSESSFTTSPPHMSTDYSFSSRLSGFILPGQTPQSSATALAETGSFNRSMNNGEGRPRLTVEGLSEILSALEYIERDEDLSYEQILMLEATILLGGIGLHDRYRDMRVDIDNMSYEELLALEERIGNVNIGLSEESVGKSVRVEGFSSREVTCGYVPQEIEIKCSICQEEFEEAVELGVLECGHSHHIACIKQWLLQKNQCPICKAPAMT